MNSLPIFISALVLIRVAAATITAPILGNTAVRFRTRIGVAMTVALFAMPLAQVPATVANQWDAAGQTDAAASQILPFVFGEAAIGFSLGLGVSIMFSAASFAGAAVSQMAGLQLGGGAFDDTNKTALEQFFFMISLAAFAIIGGPAMIISAVLDTFVHIPIGTRIAPEALLNLSVDLLQQSFMLTVRAIAPIATLLLISNLAVGLISRTYPQMNILSLGLSSNVAVLILSIFLTVGGVIWMFVDDVQPTIDWIATEMRAEVHHE